MLFADLSSAVSTYFLTHLDSEFWTALPQPSKTASVTMALADIENVLHSVTLSDVDSSSSPFVKAVSEQAVYLARNYENLTEGKITTGESLSGLSNSYTVFADNILISQRAVPFITQTKALFGVSGSLRISRG